MDVTSVLLAAGTVLGTKAVEESTKLAVAELWSSLKSLVKGQRGADSAAVQVLDEVERQPVGEPPPPALAQRVQALDLSSDPTVAALLREVEALLRQRAPTIIEKQFNFHGNTFTHTTFN